MFRIVKIINFHFLFQLPNFDLVYKCWLMYELFILLISEDTAMRFGGLISTSNVVKGEIVTVQSDSDLLWTISIKKH